MRAVSVRAGMLVLSAAVAAVAACLPRVPPLPGVPAPSMLPQAELPPGYWQYVFTWELEDPEMSGRGEGAARIATPDSVRLDFFLAGGLLGGAAVLIGDSVRLPAMDMARRLIPSPPMLWAALGRSALPRTADTTARRDGDRLRADLGSPAQWRVTYRGDSLLRVDRLSSGRIVQWVERGDSATIRFRDEPARRTLVLRITRIVQLSEFDASIWRFSQ